MPTYLLDTCAWIDALLAPELLSESAREILEQPVLVFLSSISLIELTRKEAQGGIKLHMPCKQWLTQVALPPRISVLPITPDIAVDATRLPAPFVNSQGKPHKDPADQIIVATSRCHQLTLVTSDQVLLSYPHLSTIPSRS